MNRQRYMAELSKLLAFMFKEDKEDILAQYNKMLDEAEDEQAMLESFGSPTRLAVTISRTYKRSERKLSVEADSKDDGSTGESAMPFAPAAAKVKEPESAPEETTLSYADIIEEIRREKAQEEGIEYKPIFFNEPEPEPEPMPETPAVEEQPPAGEPVDDEAFNALKAKFVAALDNDLNTSLAVTALYDVLKYNTNDDTKLAAIADFDKVLSLSLIEKANARREELKKQTVSSGAEFTGEADAAVEELLKARAAAKKAKNFAEADSIRDELKSQGIEVTDIPNGAKWKRL